MYIFSLVFGTVKKSYYSYYYYHKIKLVPAQAMNQECRTRSLIYFDRSWTRSSCFIVPIPKKGAKAEVSNYRGIALQSMLPKNFDKLLTFKLQTHMHKLIPATQHGFMRSKGTQTNLLEKTQFIAENASGNQI